MKTTKLISEIIDAATDVKAESPQVLDLRKLTNFTDYFVILGGRSDRQVQAIADRILERLSDQKIKPLGIEGYESAHWILLDFGEVIVHVFYSETRIFYALDRLWSDAPQLDLESSARKAAR